MGPNRSGTAHVRARRRQKAIPGEVDGVAQHQPPAKLCQNWRAEKMRPLDTGCHGGCGSLHVHGIAEVRQDLLGAPQAGFGIRPDRGPRSESTPGPRTPCSGRKAILPVANVDVIEFRHAAILRSYSALSCGPQCRRC